MKPFKLTDVLLTTFKDDNRTVQARHIPTGLQVRHYKNRVQLRNKMACIMEIEAKLVVVDFFEKIIELSE